MQSDAAPRPEIGAFLKSRIGSSPVPIYRGGAADAQSVGALAIIPVSAVVSICRLIPFAEPCATLAPKLT